MKIIRFFMLTSLVVLINAMFFISYAWGVTATVPNNLSAIATSCQQIDLTWTATNQSDTTLSLEVGYNGSNGYFGYPAGISSSDKAYSATSLQENREYCYRIKGYKSAIVYQCDALGNNCSIVNSCTPSDKKVTCKTDPEDTKYSNTVCPTTKSVAPVTPGIPSITVNSSYIYLTWIVNPNGNPSDPCVKQTGFQIWRQAGLNPSSIYGYSGTNSYSDLSVTEGTYTYQVGAYLSSTGTYSKLSTPAKVDVVSLSVASTGSGSINGTGINCSGNCNLKVLMVKGYKVTLTAVPSAGQKFGGWGGNGSCTASATTCTLPMNSSISVTASFIADPNQALLSVTSTGQGKVSSNIGGINCPSICSNYYQLGTTIILTALPEPGQKLEAWGGACAGQGNPCNLTVKSATTITANFVRDPNQKLVSVAVDGQGKVSSSGINCPSDCSEYYPIGTKISLNASPNQYWKFDGWTDSNCQGQGNPCSFTVSGDLSVKAKFSNPPVTLSLSTSGGRGTVTGNGISCSDNCSLSLTPGTQMTLTATPGPGQKFGSWSGCTSQTNTCTLTVYTPTSVSANFIRDPNQILVTISIIGQGSVSNKEISCPSVCSAYYPRNIRASITLIANATSGEKFNGWTGACVGITNPCTITLGSDRVITAQFSDSFGWLPPIIKLIDE
ncbi:MAG: hypothetical protein NTX45_13390 [Proteobacteria bacterium]|nr:hypothetical protein [Pseudomonadota bacterium]